MRSSTAGFLQPAGAIACVWAGGNKLSRADVTGSARGARHIQRSRAEARGMSLAMDREKPQSTDKPTLYKQIRLDIERRVLTGEWPPGYRIPFEHELMTRYGCSRMTVSKALSKLARADLIERRRRAGTLVRRPKFLSAVLRSPISARRSSDSAAATPISWSSARAAPQTPPTAHVLGCGKPAK